MNPRQSRFIDEYLVDLNGTQAAIRAGYAKKSADVHATRLLANASVRAAIDAAMAKRSERTEITQDMVLKELAKIGFANMGDYMKVGPDGDPALDFSGLDDAQKAALVEVTVDDYYEGRGEDARQIRRVKFKLADKRAALVDIGKHLGMFIEKREITGRDGKDLVPEAPKGVLVVPGVLSESDWEKMMAASGKG